MLFRMELTSRLLNELYLGQVFPIERCATTITSREKLTIESRLIRLQSGWKSHGPSTAPFTL